MDANKIIDSFGGTRAVAQIFEITDGAVSQWRTNGIPKASLMVLELLRPDLFDQPKDMAEKREHSTHVPGRTGE